MQVLYTPGVEESFYWYTGAVNYTFVFALSLFLLLLFFDLSTKKYKKGTYVWRVVLACILAVLVGGDNFSTSLSTLLTLLLLSAFFLWKDRKAFRRTWFVPALLGISLLICVRAPGITARLEGNFGGETTGDAVGAILKSLTYSLRLFYQESFHVRTALFLLLLLPFLWKAVKNMEYQFRLPGLFTLVSFCLYASQVTPNMYVEGTIYSYRLQAVLYYSYHLWLIGNVGYWLGWLGRREGKAAVVGEKICGRMEKYILLYCAVVGILLAGVIYRNDLKELSSYRAYRSLRQGWAAQYGKEWEERLAVLHDGSVKEVTFVPISVYPEVIMYTDLQAEDGFVWVNGSCAKYYDKDGVYNRLSES